MTDKPISKKVLWDNIQGWIDECKYYDGEKPKEIPLSELKLLIEECPTMGEDVAYLRNKRLEVAKKEAQAEIAKEVFRTVEPYLESEAEND